MSTAVRRALYGKMSGDSSGLRGAGLFASWELDLWGRVLAVVRSTELSYQATALDAIHLRLRLRRKL